MTVLQNILKRKKHNIYFHLLAIALSNKVLYVKPIKLVKMNLLEHQTH